MPFAGFPFSFVLGRCLGQQLQAAGPQRQESISDIYHYTLNPSTLRSQWRLWWLNGGFGGSLRLLNYRKYCAAFNPNEHHAK